ncbi:hypothetical protein ACFX2J_000583 [Malus domestica]
MGENKLHGGKDHDGVGELDGIFVFLHFLMDLLQGLSTCDHVQKMLTPTSHMSCWGTIIQRPSFSSKACCSSLWYLSDRLPGTISCISIKCHNVNKVITHESTITTHPGPYLRLDVAKGRPRTPAPTMELTLWKAAYHQFAFLDEVIGSQSFISFCFLAFSSSMICNCFSGLSSTTRP